MHVLMTSIVIVALAEMGDKTQLLAIILAARFGKPVPIIAGIFVATLANHAIAAFAGTALASLLDGPWFRYGVAASFVAMAGWALVPDKADDESGQWHRFGPFVTTCIAFFIVEIGDKTQVATIALGARFMSVAWVTMGTTIGMMIANVPAVYMGQTLVKRVPLRTVRIVVALLFLGLGLLLGAETAGLI